MAGLSAARTYGLWAGFDPRLHVALPANASRLRTNFAPSFVADRGEEWPTALTPDTAEREVVLHWLASPSTSLECWRSSIPETLAQVALWSDRESAVACLDTARTVLGLCDAVIDAALGSSTAGVRLLGRASKPGSDSGFESVVRQRVTAMGINVVQQVAFSGVGFVDMQLVGTNILIELDGREFHTDPVAFENDRRRRNELVRRGYVVLEFSFKQVFENWAWCASLILGALTQFRS